MNDKYFRDFWGLVDNKTTDIHKHFSMYNALSKVAFQTKKASYSDYDLQKMVGGFSREVNSQCSKLLETISDIFTKSGRKLSAKQYNILIDMCTKTFTTIIDNYKTAFQEEFNISDTLEIQFRLCEEDVSNKINKHIKALKILINTKIDKALWWTAIGTVFAGVSLILSVVAIIVAN